MSQLPADWDLLYLTTASCRTGGRVGAALRVARDCSGTYAFVATRRFALKVRCCCCCCCFGAGWLLHSCVDGG